MTRDEVLAFCQNDGDLRLLEERPDGSLLFRDKYHRRDVLLRPTGCEANVRSLITCADPRIDLELLALAIEEQMDPTYLMTVRGIHLITSLPEWRALRQAKRTTMRWQHDLGQYHFKSSMIYINVPACIRASNDVHAFPDQTRGNRNEALLMTVAHELRHAHQWNPLFEDALEAEHGGSFGYNAREEDAEDYAVERAVHLFQSLCWPIPKGLSANYQGLCEEGCAAA